MSDEVKVLRARQYGQDVYVRACEELEVNALVITGIDVPEWVPSGGEIVDWECDMPRRVTVGSTPFVMGGELFVLLKDHRLVRVEQLRPIQQTEKVTGERMTEAEVLEAVGSIKHDIRLPVIREMEAAGIRFVRVEEE